MDETNGGDADQTRHHGVRGSALLRSTRSLITLGTVLGIPGLLAAWGWRILLLPADGPVSAAFALWSIVLTAFWWQIGLAAIVPASLAWALRARGSATAWMLLALLGLGPTLLGTAYASARPSASSQSRPTIAVYSANLLYGRADLDAIADEIRAHGFDVLLFQEVTPHAAAGLRDRFSDAYPHQVLLPQNGAFGQAVLSRLAFTEPPRDRLPPELLPDQSFPTIGVNVALERASGPVALEIWNVHTVPPMGLGAVRHQDRMCRAIADMIAQNTSGPNRPMILGGDFNSPEAGAPVRRIVRAGAAPATLRPAAWAPPTWPAPRDRNSILHRAARLLGGARIDHVLATPHFAPLEGSGPGSPNGSDHRPMMFFAELTDAQSE